jgi:hypothetical protein
VAYIRRVDEQTATGPVKADFDFLSGSYSKLIGRPVPTPQVYTTSSIIPAYFNFGALQNRVLTHDGAHDQQPGLVPNILVNFAVSFYSACFY